MAVSAEQSTVARHAVARTEPYWIAKAGARTRIAPALAGDVEVDVVVIGAGIVGLTAAELVRRGGRTVAVLEAREVGTQATGRSTAKLTSQHNLIYQKLLKDFGEDGAREYATANQAAIERVAGFVGELGIDCGFERTSAYVYGRSAARAEAIRAEVAAAVRLGLPAAWVSEAPLPFAVAGAIRFDNQAQFDPCRYLRGLATAFRHAGPGGQIFEGTRAVSVTEGEPCTVKTEQGHTVRATEVIVATQMPTIPDGAFFAKAYPFSHPMAAAKIDAARAPEGMFISADTPTHSFRVDRRNDGTYLIAVGGAFQPGNTREEMEMADDLERFLHDAFGIARIDYRWVNEDYGSMDGVPFIGHASGEDEHTYVATGFNAWGLSNGTAAGMILADLVLGQRNAWEDAFDATRVKPVAAGRAFLKGNMKVARRRIGDRMRKPHLHIDDLAPGEAATLELDGERVAAFKDERGRLHAVSAICTHLGCVVGWNPIDRTWDCPCHGSRFEHDGSVLQGPAVSPLEKKDNLR